MVDIEPAKPREGGYQAMLSKRIIYIIAITLPLWMECTGWSQDGWVDVQIQLVRAEELTLQKNLAELMTTQEYPVLQKLVIQWRVGLSDASRARLVQLLLERMPSNEPLTLRNYADMFIMSRVESGKMEFMGHGVMVEQDLFLEGGRSAWAIQELLGCTLPPIEDGLTEAKLRDRLASAKAVIEAKDPRSKSY